LHTLKIGCFYRRTAASNPCLGAPIVRNHDTPITAFLVCESATCDPAQQAEWTSLTDWCDEASALMENMASANGRDPHEPRPNETDEIAEPLKRDTEARVACEAEVDRSGETDADRILILSGTPQLRLIARCAQASGRRHLRAMNTAERMFWGRSRHGSWRSSLVVSKGRCSVRSARASAS
jgi:hypothetical protein